MKKYKIIIRGGYGLTNFGDDALMYILIKKLMEHYHNEDIALLCKSSSYIKKLIPSCTILDSRKNDIYAKTDIILYGGGTQFYSFSGTSSKQRLLKYIINPSLFVKKLLLKIKRNSIPKIILYKEDIETKSTGAIGIGVGPFEGNNFTEEETKKLFLKMDFIAVRDIYSINKCKIWGLEKTQHFSDLCYLFDNKDLNISEQNINSKVKSIGIIVRDWPHTDKGSAYYTKIEPLIHKLKNNGYNVNIIIFAKGRDSFWLERLKNVQNVIQWNPDKQTINEFITTLNLFDLFISARYHGAIFSALLNKPFISISVEQKLDMISDIYVNASKKWQYPFNIEDCINNVKFIDDNYHQFVKQVKLTNKEQQKLAHSMLNNFLEYSKKFN